MIDIRPIQIGNEHFVEIRMDGTVFRRPAASADAAESAANRAGAVCRALFGGKVHVGDAPAVARGR